MWALLVAVSLGVVWWLAVRQPEPAQAAARSDASAAPVEHYIWGATAGMLRNFYRFLLA